MGKSRGWWFRWRGRIGSAFVLVFVGLVSLSRPVIQHDSMLDLGFDALAWITFLGGVATRFWATLYIGGRKTRTLAVEGPYSICRNPLYLGSLLLLLSAGLYLKSLTFLLGSTLPILAYVLGTIPAEERTLRDMHGQAYDEYCQTVARLWPRLRRFQTPEVIEVSNKGLRLECARALRWVWIPIVGEAVAHLRMQPWWPQLLHLP